MHSTKNSFKHVKTASRSIFAKSAYSVILAIAFSTSLHADSNSQAKRMHDRLAGVPPTDSVLSEMSSLIDAGRPIDAANVAMENPNFYNVTLKNWISPWTNEDSDIFVPLNDYTSTVIGIVRDDVDFRQILSGDILYVAEGVSGIPAYSVSNNNHYESLENNGVDLSASLVRTTQSSVTGLPAYATAGVMTTRAAAKAYFIDGTNRAMLRFTLIHHLCTDLEALKDTSLPPDRIRQDLSRSPGGDSRIFANSCVGCHSGMDPLAQAFAYYNYEYSAEDGSDGRLSYNSEGMTDERTGSRVTFKHRINENNFIGGYIIEDDRWDNYWRDGINQTLGWSQQLQGYGYGAKTMGDELANSQKFAQCQVTKVFENVCLRSPQDSADRSAIDNITQDFMQNGYLMKPVFAATANYCKGE